MRRQKTERCEKLQGNSCPGWRKCFVAAFFVVLLLLCGENLATATTLDGKDLRFTHEFPNVSTVLSGPVDFVVGPGVDVTPGAPFVGEYKVDVSDTQILIDFDLTAAWGIASFNGPHFFDFTGTIDAFTSVTLNSTSFLPSEFDGTGVIFDADNIFVHFSVLGSNLNADANDFILLDVQVIPEPSTFAIGLMGLLSLSCYGRRRRKR